MRRILKIAQREYVETVKTKTFLLGVLVTPLIIGGILLFTGRARHDMTPPRPPRHVAVANLATQLSGQIKALANRAFRPQSE